MSTEESEITLRSLAVEITAAQPDPQKARAMLLDRIANDKQLLESLLSEILDAAIGSAVYLARHHESSHVRNDNAPRGADGILDAANLIAGSFLRRWIMPDGRQLGQWKGTELIPQAEEDAAVAKGHEDKATFYRTLGKKCGSRAVASVMDSQAAFAMFKMIQNGKTEGRMLPTPGMSSRSRKSRVLVAA